MAEESTTPDLVELVSQRSLALIRGEMDMDTFLDGYAKDAVLELTRQGRTLQGRPAIGVFVEEWLAGFEDLEFTVAEARELGNGVVFAVFHQRGRPAGTSRFVQQRDCWVNVFGDGLIKRATVYHDIDEARAAAERLAHERAEADEDATPDVVEIVRGLFEAADREDWDAVVGPYASDVIWESEDGVMSADGANAVRALWEGWAGTFEDFRIEAESVVDLGGGVVHAVYRQQGRIAGSSGLLTARGVLVYEWQDGMILRVFAWPATDQARAAAERLAEERG